MCPSVTGANFPMLVGGMPVSLHHHPHSGKNRRAMQKGEPAHDAVADSAKRLPLRAPHRPDLQCPAIQRLELGVCLGHDHPTTTFVQ